MLHGFTDDGMAENRGDALAMERLSREKRSAL